MTYRGNEVLCSQSKVLGHSYWLSVHTRGGRVQHGTLGSEVITSRHLHVRRMYPIQIVVQKEHAINLYNNDHDIGFCGRLESVMNAIIL